MKRLDLETYRPNQAAYPIAKTIFAHTFRNLAVFGQEHLPKDLEMPFFCASNHVTMWDPPLLGHVLGRPATYIAKAELFKNPLIGTVLRSAGAVPVRRSRKNPHLDAHLRASIADNRPIVIFPEGTRQKGMPLSIGRFDPAFPCLVRCYRLPVLPVFIEYGCDRKPVAAHIGELIHFPPKKRSRCAHQEIENAVRSGILRLIQNTY